MGVDVFLISAPAEPEFLGYSGEHTSILYAAAVLWDRVKKGEVAQWDGTPVKPLDIKYFAWRALNSHVWAELSDAMSRHRPRVVAVSLCTASSRTALDIARLAKKTLPNCLVVFGGPHEDDVGKHIAVPSGAEQSCDVDVSVSGDGEFALDYLVSRAIELRDFSPRDFLAQTEQHVERIKQLPGSGMVQFRGSPTIRFRRPLPLHLPRIPRALLIRDQPALARGFSEIASSEGSGRTAQILTERGCAWSCDFCAEWRGYYARLLDDVVAEIEEARELNYAAIWFEDSTFLSGFGIGTPKRAKMRLEARRTFVRKLIAFLSAQEMEWGCQTRVDTIEPNIVRQMRAAGCTYMYFGAESASDTQLDEMKKQQSKSEIRKALKHVRDAGIRIGLSTLFGMPARDAPYETRETRGTVAETISFFAQEIRKGGIVTISRNIMAYYPGAIRTSTLDSTRTLDFWQGLPLSDTHGIPTPWNRFEDGAGHHARNMSAELAEYIVRRGDQKLGPWVIKSYIHACADHRVPVKVDLVGYTRDELSSGTDTPRDEGLEFHDDFATGLGRAIASKCFCGRPTRRPQVLIIGMHLVEAARRLAYVRRPSDCPVEVETENIPISWWPIWDVESEDDLIARLQSKSLENVRVAVIPKVLPETGHSLDLRAIVEHLKNCGFAGSIVVDCSDDIHALDSGDFEYEWTTWICRPRRVTANVIGGCALVHGRTRPQRQAKKRVVEFFDSLAQSNGRLSLLSRQREEMIRERRQSLLDRLSLLVSDLEIVSNPTKSAAHILAVRLPNIDQFMLVERLWRDHGVLTTFVGPLNLLRFQLDEHVSDAFLNETVSAIAQILPSCRNSCRPLFGLV